MKTLAEEQKQLIEIYTLIDRLRKELRELRENI